MPWLLVELLSWAAAFVLGGVFLVIMVYATAWAWASGWRRGMGEATVETAAIDLRDGAW